MVLTVTSVDYAPEELYKQLPLELNLLRQLAGPDRPDYWIAEIKRPVFWNTNNVVRDISHVIVAARWTGTKIEPNVENLPIGIAYVTDGRQLTDETFDFAKCAYVAIGLATETGHGKMARVPTNIMTGRIAPAFGMAKRSEENHA